MCKFCLNAMCRWSDSRSSPEDHSNCQPFIGGPTIERLLLGSAHETGRWGQFMSAEETAYALAKVTSAYVLPPLTELPSGADLLAYQVLLRDRLSGALVDELRMILQSVRYEHDWQQVGAWSYLCVIGAGVAACLDIPPGTEQLTLRYATDLQNELFLAGRSRDLPRSRLGLQTTLYEKFDALLCHVRARTWHWLYG